MNGAWPTAVSSALATTASAPLVRTMLLRRGRVDVPNHRSSHLVPTPRGGGIACLIGLAVGVLTAALTEAIVPWVAVAACVAISVVGWLDDHRDLSAVTRLLAQVSVGVLSGWVIGGPVLAAFGGLLFAVTINTVNFMDGINGLTAVTMAIWGLTTLLLASQHADRGLGVVGALALGLSAGFLPWNVGGARLFLGDVGSYLFGALCGVALLMAISSAVPVTLLLAPLILYFFDVFLTLVRRVRSGARVTQAHNHHVYQQLARAPRLTHAHVTTLMASITVMTTAFWWATPWPVAMALTLCCLGPYGLSPSMFNRYGVNR